MDLPAWTTRSSTYIHKDRWIALRADSCQTSDGHIIEPFYILEYPDYIQVFAVTPDGKAVLNRQYRHGLQRTLLELPCGIMDPTDASPIEAAQRELLEETGYAGTEFVYLGQGSPNAANHTNMAHFVLILNAVRVTEKMDDPTEQIESFLLPLADVKQKLLAGEFLQSVHISTLFLGLHHLGEL